jgi:long-chain fatty acid transport protein
MKLRHTAVLALALGSIAALSWPVRVMAGGLYISDRGTRALGRGGAFTAGASGIEAVGHNPAGLTGTGVLGELTLPIVSASYRRRLAIDDGTGTTRDIEEPTLNGDSERLPFPTLVGAFTPKSQKYTIAAGLITPTFSLLNFPNQVNGQPTVARYTLSGFTDSRVIMAGVWARIRLHDILSLGLGVHGLMGTFRSTVGFTLSIPDRTIAAPEDVDYDATGRISVGPMVAPSGSAGLLLTPLDRLRIGLAGELPIWIDSDATFDVRLPSSAAFEGVKVEGNKAHLKMRLPAILRAGVEVLLSDHVAVELTYVREFWSLHDNIDVHPDNVRVTGSAVGPDEIVLPNIRIPRHFKDSNSLRAGLELKDRLLGFDFSLRAGVAFESSAVPPSYLSLSSLDLQKWMLTLGGGLYFTKWLSGDLAYVYVRTRSANVAPEDARLTRINPLSGNAPPEYVNGGHYQLGAHVLSGALKAQF